MMQNVTLPPSISTDLMQYQIEGVQFLAGRRVAMLLDQQGLGKTPTAIRAADLVNAHRVVVVCPAIGRVMWQRAFARWGTELHHVRVFSYDEIARRSQDPRHYSCDLLILDEAQYLKNQSTNRALAIYGYLARRKNCLAETAERVWLLSGTLTPNGAHELYTHLRALLPELITLDGAPMLEWQFLARYFHAGSDPVTQRLIVRGPKAGAIDELRAKIQPHFLRRLKKDVLPQLPPLRTEVAVMPYSAPNYSAEQLRLIEQAIDALGCDEDVDPVPLSTIRRITGEAKVKPAVEYIRETLEGEPKVVVFAHHRNVIEGLHAGLREFNPVLIHGGMTDAQRQRSIDSFQTDPRVRVVIGQITACNAVIDLTAASREVFVEWSFVPGENAQAAERCHRFTTKNAVLASFLSLQDSLDEAITRVVERKTAALAALWR